MTPNLSKAQKEGKLMVELSSSTVTQFLERFNHCYDGLIREVRISYPSRYTEIILSVRDKERSRNQDWINLSFRIEGMSEFSLREGNITCVVLSMGFKLAFSMKIFILIFAHMMKR